MLVTLENKEELRLRWSRGNYSKSHKAGKYFYDLFLQDASGTKTRPVEGTITVKKSVTR